MFLNIISAIYFVCAFLFLVTCSPLHVSIVVGRECYLLSVTDGNTSTLWRPLVMCVQL